jgi:hypothetical protein
MSAADEAVREQRRRKGEIRDKIGIAIISPYGGIWTDEIFETADAAFAHLKEHYSYPDTDKFKLAMAVQTTEIYRGLGEPEFIPLPKPKSEAASEDAE